VAADIWRTSGDIVDPIVANSKNSGRRASFQKMLSNFDQSIHPEAQHTGFYNDPDMMVIGMPGLTDAENRVHMSLWAMSGAPLLVGADLTKLSEATHATLTNAEVLAVDQDALGLQAFKVAQQGTGLEVWSKFLSKSGSRAVLLLNRTASAATISFKGSDLGLLGSPSFKVRDLWAGKALGAFNLSCSASVPAGDAVMLLVSGSEGKLASYKASGVGRQPISFTDVASQSHIAQIQIAYANPDKKARFAELRVNGQVATRIAFPSTGGAVGSIWIQSLLDRTGANNVLSFSISVSPGPEIESISLQ
jgi:hypothetical protein